MDVNTGRALGRKYLLHSRLGAGAMGEVWRAEDRDTGAVVAAKLLRGEYTRDPQIVGRFIQERAILLTLDHPNIVRVRDMVVEDEDLAIVMDFVDGQDLRSLLEARGTLEPGEAARIAGCVARALAYAHAHSCLHRDVKPDNVLLGGKATPAVYLTDFGIARLATETSMRATTGLGTPDYMAPEIFTTEQVSVAADVYGVGVLLYELLAGRTPYAGAGSQWTIANRHVTTAPPPIPDLPAPLWTLLAAMLDKNPARRPSAERVALTLDGLAKDLSGIAPLQVQPEPTEWTLIDGGTQAARATAKAHRPMTQLQGPRVEQHESPIADGRVLEVSHGERNLTQVAPSLRAHEAPTLISEVAAPGGERRNPLLYLGGAVLVAAAIVGVVLVLPHHASSAAATAQAASAGKQNVVQTDSALPSGLTITRKGVYDPKVHQLNVTVTYQAGNSRLGGPFYEELPRSTDGCNPVWSDGTLAAPNAVAGVSSPCGWTITTTALASGESVEASYMLNVALKDADAAQKLLDDEAQSTKRTLSGKAGVADYAAQRLAGISVQLPPAVHAGAFTVRILPIWSGVDAPDPLHLLLDSSRPSSNLLLQEVAGGLSGVSLTPTVCGDSLAVNNKVQPVATHPANNCSLVAHVGQLESNNDTFSIEY